MTPCREHSGLIRQPRRPIESLIAGSKSRSRTRRTSRPEHHSWFKFQLGPGIIVTGSVTFLDQIDRALLDTSDEYKLVLSALALYLGEGTRSQAGRHGRRVEFCNSRPELAKLFLTFLRTMGINEQKLRIRVKVPDISLVEAVEAFWSDYLTIPRKQFIKPIIRGREPRQKDIRTYYGTCTLRYHNARLYRRIINRASKLVRSFAEKPDLLPI